MVNAFLDAVKDMLARGNRNWAAGLRHLQGAAPQGPQPQDGRGGRGPCPRRAGLQTVAAPLQPDGPKRRGVWGGRAPGGRSRAIVRPPGPRRGPPVASSPRAATPQSPPAPLSGRHGHQFCRGVDQPELRVSSGVSPVGGPPHPWNGTIEPTREVFTLTLTLPLSGAGYTVGPDAPGHGRDCGGGSVTAARSSQVRRQAWRLRGTRDRPRRTPRSPRTSCRRAWRWLAVPVRRNRVRRKASGRSCRCLIGHPLPSPIHR